MIETSKEVLTDLAVKTLRYTPPLVKVRFANLGCYDNGERIMQALKDTNITTLKSICFNYNKLWFTEDGCSMLLG